VLSAGRRGIGLKEGDNLASRPSTFPGS
jgi:hypothetical protein